MEQMEHLYDVVVIGGGPAGLTAALYLARARYRVVVVEQERFGGQITITSEVVNYPGVERTSGAELTETMRRQAEGFGAEFLLAEVTGLELKGDVKTVRTSRGALSCFGVLLATGAHPRMVGFRGEEQFRGRGVAYCATCDGEFFTGKDVFVVGGGFAAAEESVFLTKYARHVTILIRGDDFSCAQATADAARNHEKITILTNTVVEEVSGDTSLRSIRMRNTKTGQETEHRAADGETFGVFVFAGYEPATELVRGLAELDGQGYILTDRSQKTTADSGRHRAGAAVRCHAAENRSAAPGSQEPDAGTGGPGTDERRSVYWGDALPAPHGIRSDGFLPDSAALPGRNTCLRRVGALYAGVGCPERQAVGGAG